MIERSRGYPNGKAFAFTIVDDTDDATVENVAPLYDLMTNLGLRTTKTVWPLDCPEGSELFFAGSTLQDPAYLDFVRNLAGAGFEIAFHGATMESSDRDRTIRSLQFLEDALQMKPRLFVNHGHNAENIYWGSDRYRTGLIRNAVKLGGRAVGRQRDYMGHVEGTKYFWGDICRLQFDYVRNFSFSTLDTSSITPGRPYQLASTPYVKCWFNSSDAPDVRHFRKLVTPAGIDDLRGSGGYCILSTHLGKGFVVNGRVDPVVKETLEHLASSDGWFVPASELLDFLTPSPLELSPVQLFWLEGSHIVDRARTRWSDRQSA